jgi:hypothetical protein
MMAEALNIVLLVLTFFAAIVLALLVLEDRR